MDYFGVIQNYYTGDYITCLAEAEKSFNDEDKVLVYYKAMAQIALKKYAPGSVSSAIGKALDAYAAFLKSKDLSPLKSLVTVGTASGFELCLLAFAQTICGDLQDALDLCNKGLDGIESEADRSQNGYIELSLLAVQVYLLSGDITAASNMFFSIEQRLTLNNESEIIQNLAEAYLKFAKNQDTAGLNFYYFEELAQTYPNWRTQLGLLNLHLQQGNIAEAQGIVDVLESEYYQVEQNDSAEIFKPNYLACQITLAIMQGLNTVDAMKQELATLDPEHPFVKNDEEINVRFDELVAKFKA